MEVTIEKLIYGGEGLAHLDGHTVFVPYVLPGEMVRVREVARKKKFVRGRVQQIVSASPGRVAAHCPYFTTCGGCHYQHVPYEAQLEYKAAILRETLSRLGRVVWDGPIQSHPSPPYHYRNRAQWKVRSAGGRPAVGYFQSASTALCPVEQCPILSPCLEDVLARIRGLLAEKLLPATVREVEAFVDAKDDKVLMNVAMESFSNPPASLAALLLEKIPGIETILLQDTTRDRFDLFGPGYLTYHAGDSDYRVGHLSFFQSNRFLFDEFRETVVAETSGTLALDLFAGVGLFTLPLARRFERVIAVEQNAAAARDLDANIAAADAPAQAVNSSIEKLLRGWLETPDLVLLDPPRVGVSAEAIARIVALAPPRVHYVSCDPATLARDLKLLIAGGFHIENIHLFDMFPQTFHIETLVKLVRE